ncbi:MAG: ParB/RepB/Spo0J family partition protein [Candidatus Aminicenantes bacterium]|nr:ParB/RepB/Spo0J family partition protein [Candidatus Aminicenantes bacterium]
MEYEEIPINKIFVSKANVRTRQVEAGLDQLAANIRRVGLLHPIIVFRTDDKYELIVGQRRYLACKKLGWDRIPALITGPIDETKGRIMSLSEGIHRRELPHADLIDAIEALYMKYGSPKLIAEELGITEATVRNWLPLSLAPEPIKEMIKEKKIKPTDAKRAIAAGGTNEKKIVEIAKHITKMTTPEKRRLVDIAKEKPEVPAENLVEEAKKPHVEERVTIHLTSKYAKALDTASKDLGLDREDVAKTAVIDWLSMRGFVSPA